MSIKLKHNEDADDDELYTEIFAQLEPVWKNMNLEFEEIGITDDELKQRKEAFKSDTICFLKNKLQEVTHEKRGMKKQCLILQRNIFKILRIFSKKGYKTVPKPISAREIIMSELDNKGQSELLKEEATDLQDGESDIEISDSTYTEINQILTNESEYNDIMQNMPNTVSKQILMEKITPPYLQIHSTFVSICKQLSREYFIRLLRFLKMVLLLRETSNELEYYQRVNPVDALPDGEIHNSDSLKAESVNGFASSFVSPSDSDILFVRKLPSIEQCRICITELEKVDSTDSDMVYKVVTNLLDGNNFNHLSNQYLGKIHYQIEMIEIQREKNFGAVIDLSNNIIHLWKQLYNFRYEESTNDTRFDSRIVKASEGDVRSLGLGQSSICYLNDIHDELLVKKEMRLNDIEERIKECHTLFDRLKVNSSEVNQFMKIYESDDAVDDISEKKLNDLNNEVSLLIEKKRLYIKEIISFLRFDIEKMLEKMLIDKTSYAEDEATQIGDDDTVLSILEQRFEKLKILFEKNSSMFDRIEQFHQLMEDKKQLDEASKNPSRLLARNSGAILLKEEKLRKLIKKRFPRLCDDLSEQLTRFAEQTNNHFKKDGRFYQLLDLVNLEADKNKPRASSPAKKQSLNERLSPSKPSNFSKNVPTKSKKLSPVKSSSNIRLSPLKSSRVISPTKGARAVSPGRLAFSQAKQHQSQGNTYGAQQFATSISPRKETPNNAPHSSKSKGKQGYVSSSSPLSSSAESSLSSSSASHNGNSDRDLSSDNFNFTPIEKVNAESTPRTAAPAIITTKTTTTISAVPSNKQTLVFPPLRRRDVIDDVKNNKKDGTVNNSGIPRLSPLKRFSPIRTNRNKLPVNSVGSQPFSSSKRLFGATENIPDLRLPKRQKSSSSSNEDNYGVEEEDKENMDKKQALIIDSKIMDNSINDDSMYNSWRLKRLESIRKSVALNNNLNRAEENADG